MNNKDKKINSDTGLNCPVCNFKIKFTVSDLLLKRDITCPSCELKLDMNVPVEMKKHLQEITIAEKMVKESGNFSR